MRLTVWGVALALLLTTLPVRSGFAAALPEPIFGTATGDIEEPGSLTPLGHGRFAIQERVYVGRSLGRSVVDEWATCFTGRLTSAEEWTLEAPAMAGTQQSMVTIRSEDAVLTLRLRGRVEFPTASGTWEIVRATGACAGLVGEGRYTATYSSVSPEYRMTFDGQLRSS